MPETTHSAQEWHVESDDFPPVSTSVMDFHSFADYCAAESDVTTVQGEAVKYKMMASITDGRHITGTWRDALQFLDTTGHSSWWCLRRVTAQRDTGTATPEPGSSRRANRSGTKFESIQLAFAAMGDGR